MLIVEQVEELVPHPSGVQLFRLSFFLSGMTDAVLAFTNRLTRVGGLGA